MVSDSSLSVRRFGGVLAAGASSAEAADENPATEVDLDAAVGPDGFTPAGPGGGVTTRAAVGGDSSGRADDDDDVPEEAGGE